LTFQKAALIFHLSSEGYTHFISNFPKIGVGFVIAESAILNLPFLENLVAAPVKYSSKNDQTPLHPLSYNSICNRLCAASNSWHLLNHP
jgi:hypothetical protein